MRRIVFTLKNYSFVICVIAFVILLRTANTQHCLFIYDVLLKFVNGIQMVSNSQRTLTMFVGVVALRYQHGVDSGVPQLPQT